MAAVNRPPAAENATAPGSDRLWITL